MISTDHPRIAREKKTVKSLIKIYCKGNHNEAKREEGGFCPECSELLEYAFRRLDRCVFHENKPTCGKCPVHCYKRDMREKIRIVMRFSGRRLVFRHPILSLHHIIDGWKEVPEKPSKKPQS